MVDKYTDDKAKYRTVGVVPYAVEDRIGRTDSRDSVLMTPMTVSGTADLLPQSPMGRRNYIKVHNRGPATIDIRTETTVSGIQVASGDTWEENTDGTFYIISTGAASAVIVYERSTR